MTLAFPPPVPQRLRDMLKDYPEHIEALQTKLNRVVEKPFKGTPKFEQAIWALEDALSNFAVDASEELSAAEESGDLAAIERAIAKESLMSRARSKIVWLGDAGFSEYFRATGRLSE